MRVLVAQDGFEDVARGIVQHLAGQHDGLVVLPDRIELQGVVVVHLLGDLRADVHVVEVGYDGRALQEQDALDEALGMLHLGDRALLEIFAQAGVAPVLGHLGMHHVLVDGGQLAGKQTVQRVDKFLVSFHGSAPSIRTMIGRIRPL